MLEKEKKFIEMLRSMSSSSLDDNYLRKKLNGNVSASINIAAALQEKLPYFQAAIEILAFTNIGVSAGNLENLIDAVLKDKGNTQNLTQEEYFLLATKPANVLSSGEPAVAKVSLEQLKLVKFITDKEKQKEASLLIYERIVNFINNPNLQKKIAKHWEKLNLGEFSEIEHLLPALSNKTKPIEVSQKEISIVKVDGNKFTVGLEKVSEQNLILPYIHEIYRAFCNLERNNNIVFEKKDSNKNTWYFYFDGEEKIKEFKELIEVCLEDIQSVVKKPAIELFKQALAIYPAISLKYHLDKKLNSETQLQSKKLKL